MKIVILSFFISFVLFILLKAMNEIIVKRKIYKNLLMDSKEKFKLQYEICEEVYVLFRDKFIVMEGNGYYFETMPIEEARKPFMIETSYRDFAKIFNKDGKTYYILKTHIVSKDSSNMDELIEFWNEAENLISRI